MSLCIRVKWGFDDEQNGINLCEEIVEGSQVSLTFDSDESRVYQWHHNGS